MAVFLLWHTICFDLNNQLMKLWQKKKKKTSKRKKR